MLAIAIPSRIGGKKTYWCPSRNAMGHVPHLPFYNWLQKSSKMGTSMTSHSYETPSLAEVCASVKRLGYGSLQSIRLYGEEFEVISNPFPEAGGIAVSVKTKKGDGVRVIQLPATVLQSVEGSLPNVA
jgi:hypothetical protein